MQINKPITDDNAEMSVLGAALTDNASMKIITASVDAMDFYPEKHRIIFRAMFELHSCGEPIDFVTLSAKIKENGGNVAAPYLLELCDFSPTSANVRYYLRLMKHAAVSRQLAELGAKLMNQGGDVFETLTAAKEEIAEINSRLDGLNGVQVSDIQTLDNRAERYYRYIRQIDRARFTTGFHHVDQLIRGVAPGEVMQIVAYSGTYKTAFLQNLLLRGAERTGYYQLFFSMEMPAEKIFEREVQYAAEISGHEVERIYRNDRSDKETANLTHAAVYRCGSPGMLICDKPRLSLEKIGRYIELARQKYGKVSSVGIDYMGLMDAPGKSLYDKTAFISAETKNMAKELQVPIIMLCQVNRESAKNIKGIETHSAKGGGDIEAGADFMIGFYNDGDNLMCKLLKNRNGPAPRLFKVDIEKSHFKFRDIVPYEEPATDTSKKQERGF